MIEQQLSAGISGFSDSPSFMIATYQVDSLDNVSKDSSNDGSIAYIKA
jgi:hypothetical protein